MKKIISIFIFLSTVFTVMSQAPQAHGDMGPQGHGQRTMLQRKFNIILNNETDEAKIQRTNAQLAAADEETRSLTSRGILGDALNMSYKSALLTKTVNASSNLLSFGISTLVEATRSKQNDWYRAAQQQCRFSRPLASITKTDDFYALPSQDGALDPRNMKFCGFGLQHFLSNPQNPENGQPIMKMFCRVKTDEEGIQSIVNHGKFLVELEELWFKPAYCGLPNDSSAVLTPFNFEKRKDLQLNIKVKIFSSWMNELMNLTTDKQLGEFNIVARIDPKALDADSVFIYDANNPTHHELVSLSGDCFMVPRSYTGTMDMLNTTPSWGTGEYRVEMELTETCSINDDYYLIRESGNAQSQVDNAIPGKSHWDKSKWQTEWNAMKKARKSDGFLRGAWQSIVVAYRGSGWIETFTDPLTTSIASWETQKLSEWLQLTPGASASSSQNRGASGSQGATQSQAAGQQPQGAGGQPQNGGQPQGSH